MTITEAEIRAALARAVDQAELEAPEIAGSDDLAPARRSRRARRTVFAAAGVAAALVVVAGLAQAARDDTQHVRTDPQGSEGGPAEGSATSSTTPDGTTTAPDPVTTTASVATTAPGSEPTTTSVGRVTGTTAVSGAEVPPPSAVRVLAVNGSARSGAAGDLRARLIGLGYQALPVQNAWQPFLETWVYFAPASEAAARDLAGRLGVVHIAPLPANSLTGDERADPAEADVYVAIGADGVAPTG